VPGLYRVVNGIDVFDPRFNIVSPGADIDVYFPYSEHDRRLTVLHDEIENLIYGAGDANARGQLRRHERPLLFTMARLDRIKNVAGLVQWYAESDALRAQVDLLVIAGHVRADASVDREEIEQIEQIHALMDRHGLDGQMRWLGMQLDKNLAGELYRYVADRRGVFVQPAWFEAFGLTVIEAMTSGLPTFATRYGGPLEIIEDGVSGFHLDPNNGAEVAARIADFMRQCSDDPALWHRVSDASVARIKRRYTWSLYAERMMTLARIYGFWKYVTNLERAELRRYLEMFYGLQWRPLAAGVSRR
jgi:sucrose synthase